MLTGVRVCRAPPGADADARAVLSSAVWVPRAGEPGAGDWGVAALALEAASADGAAADVAAVYAPRSGVDAHAPHWGVAGRPVHMRARVAELCVCERRRRQRVRARRVADYPPLRAAPLRAAPLPAAAPPFTAWAG